MEVKPTARDQKILAYLKENYSCKICNNILIQCITLSCGHNYCGYCMDMLGGMTRQCPQCLLVIKRSSTKPNSRIDQEIDELINSCSEPIQKAYAVALDSRFKKSLARNKKRTEQNQINDRHNDESASPRSLDEIYNSILVNNMNMNQEHSVAKALKSARKSSNPFRSTSCTTSSQTPRRTGTGPQIKNTTNAQKIPKNNLGQSQTGIDVNKVDMLFGIYDHVLNIENEPNKEMAGGDFAREQPTQSMDIKPMAMQNFAKRNEIQLATLIKETEDIIQLDNHIQKWTGKMNDALTGKADAEEMSIGIPDEKFDENMHQVDDELWRASFDLLEKLKGMQHQRKSVVATFPSSASVGIPMVPSPPAPRSGKLDLDAVSDDSDVEEYEITLESLQESLNGEKQSVDATVNTPHTSHNEAERGRTRNNKACSKSSKRKSSITDSIEESGNCYVKDNIEFITQMRKYKAALMKIQNQEVQTAAEIKELLPTDSFPSDENRYGQGQDYMGKCGGATTPRRLSHMSPIKPNRHKHSASTKLPSQLPRRPMTASYDMPSISKQIITPAATKQYMKRGRANPLYTAR
ncbi:unnamed protein product [Orchesella dallaii]|uniref:RING-type domain-containing protein n=1 Tax=Orchesella dallaii TaxID=48710 RepID=A0ABP1QXP5_9HEXA